jgi:hypothetical protein
LNIYIPNLTPRWQEAYDITTGLISKLRTTVEQNGSKFVLVTLTNAEQVHPELAAQFNKKYGLVFDYELPNKIFGEFARREGITLLQLMPMFKSYHLKTGQYLHGFGPSIIGHWNEYGHRLAADEILKFLTRKKLVLINPPIATHASK